MILHQGTTVTAAQRVYVCRPGMRARIEVVRFANTGTATATVTVLHTRFNEPTTATRNTIVASAVLSGNASPLDVAGVPMETGEAIWLLGSNTNVAVTIYGSESPMGGTNGG